jgi:hypothetical protein
MRNPSINVTSDKLRDVLTKHFGDFDYQKLQLILRDLSQTPCNWRTIQMKDKQVQRLTNNTVTSKVAGILAFKAKLHNIKLPTMKPSSPNWWVVEKLSQIAVDLFDLYELQKSIDTVIQNMVDAILVRGIKSKDLPTRALEYYENESIKLQVEEYEHKQLVLDLQRIYLDAVRRVDNKTLYDAGQDIVPFFRMVQDIIHYEADPADWIQAQFDAFMVFNTLPKPNTLYGEKSYERYVSYKSRK